MQQKTIEENCPNCGVVIAEPAHFCPQCGASLIGSGGVRGVPAENDPQPVDTPNPYNPAIDGAPKTIDDLRTFCRYHGMPLEQMRFFVGEDYPHPRAFGIYQDGDRYVVYKNKADGSRAVRYQGPDEAYAVNELYTKLLDECHKRNIWPGGKPESVRKQEKKSMIGFGVFVAVLVIGALIFFVLGVIHENRVHAHDGYYRSDNSGIYYRYGDSWYYNDGDYDWVYYSGVPYDEYDDYWLGDTYEGDWGYSDFTQSKTWEDLHDDDDGGRTNSHDYDSWDSFDTDWDSDW